MRKLSFLVFVGVFFGCRDSGTEPTKLELLTSATWRYEKYVSNGADVTPSNVTVVFNADGTYLVNSGGSTPTTYRWEFANNDQEILFNKGTRGPSSATIAELSLSRLWLKGLEPGTNDAAVSFEAVLIPTTN